MKKRTKVALFSLACAVAVIGAALAGAASPFAKTTTSSAASAVTPVQASCNAVTVTNVSSQSLAANQGEKITVDWTFTDTDCVKAEGFEVFIEVTRRTKRKNTRKLDVSATARSANATFTEVGIGNLSDKIESANVVVTAKLSNAKGTKTQTGL